MTPVWWLWACRSTKGWSVCLPLPLSSRWDVSPVLRVETEVAGTPLPCLGRRLRSGLLQGRLPEQCGGTGQVPGWVFRLVVHCAGQLPRKAVGMSRRPEVGVGPSWPPAWGRGCFLGRAGGWRWRGLVCRSPWGGRGWGPVILPGTTCALSPPSCPGLPSHSALRFLADPWKVDVGDPSQSPPDPLSLR